MGETPAPETQQIIFYYTRTHVKGSQASILEELSHCRHWMERKEAAMKYKSQETHRNSIEAQNEQSLSST